MRVTHHELCFGCGTANLFGFQIEMEAEPDTEGVVGRFFLKQDHQGPPGLAHPGIVGAALEEAMSLALEEQGVWALPESLDIRSEAPAPIGVFVRLSARVASREPSRLRVTAEAALVGAEARRLATADGVFTPWDATG